jgi:methyl-accepting chemotaxis protein
MDAEKINALLMVFTGVLAVAILMQSIIFIGMYRYIRRMTAWMESVSEELLKNIDTVSAKAGEALATVKAVGEDLKPISEKLNSITEIVHNRIAALDAFLDDTTNRARLEILRIQDSIELASQRVGDTMNILQKSILAPVNEINAIARGISAGIDMFFRRKRNLSAVSHQDEEMFI